MLRNLLILVLIIFFVVASVSVYSLATGLNDAQESVLAPVEALVRGLAFEATPVVLPDPTVIVHEINTLARLETASMTMEKIVRAERNTDQLWGVFGEELIFVAYGEVIAGVDLAQMQPEDMVVVDPETVMVHLPPAEIFIATLDNEQSYVADRDKGWFASVDPQLETLVRQEAERQIEEAAYQADILTTANNNAEAYMREFLGNLGFTNIIFMDSTPPPAPAYEQVVPKGYTLDVTPTPAP